MTKKQKAAAIAHEMVHALNHIDGSRYDKAIFKDSSHIAIYDLDFNKEKRGTRKVENTGRASLDRDNSIYNPSSWAAFIAGEEFEGK